MKEWEWAETKAGAHENDREDSQKDKNNSLLQMAHKLGRVFPGGSKGTTKQFLALILWLPVIGLSFTPAPAALSNSAVATVFVNVVPDIAVAVKTPVVNAGTIQQSQGGDFLATIVFTIGANSPKVKMFLEASDLYKGDDPASAAVPPILLNTGKSAGIATQFGKQTKGGPDKANWLGAGANVQSFKTRMTETVDYESSQKGYISQDVTCTVFYTQPDPKKPVGQYSGRVRLTAFITP